MPAGGGQGPLGPAFSSGGAAPSANRSEVAPSTASVAEAARPAGAAAGERHAAGPAGASGPAPARQHAAADEAGGAGACVGTVVPAAGAADAVERERRARAGLTRVVEPGDPRVGAWLATEGVDEVWRALRTDRRHPSLSPRRWAGLVLRARRAVPERDLEEAAAVGARFVCPGGREWPSQLSDLGPEQPVGVWVRGAASLRFLALRSVAVVGARACTDYGGYLAAELSAALAQEGWTVVSGAAYGIDGAAHQGVLRAGGSTVAVLACGVDSCYPAGHHDLIRRIADTGLLVSELPPGERPTRTRFLQRNRVLAALSRGTVVVEAALRSGALSTARHAVGLGRQVMGMPGSVYSAHSEGVHQLLRGEAALVTRADEVVELVGRMGELAQVRHGGRAPGDLLAPEASRVLEALPARGGGAPPTGAPMGLATQEIAARACTSERDAAARLQELHALGLVERIGGCWRLTPARRDRPATRHADHGRRDE